MTQQCLHAIADIKYVCKQCHDEEVAQLTDLIRFLSNAVTIGEDVRAQAISMSETDCKEHLIMKYPTIQGIRNQMNLRSIGNQPFKKENIATAVIRVLKNL